MQPEVETAKAFIRMDEEEILRVRMKNRARLNENDTIECFDVYRKWGCNKKKVLELMEVKDIFMLDEKAQQYASIHSKDFFIAVAIVNGSTGIRILLNLYNKFFNTGVPFKNFSSEESALQWLRQFKEA
jgi:hypothetical protein